jgi:hypothetical protein
VNAELFDTSRPRKAIHRIPGFKPCRTMNRQCWQLFQDPPPVASTSKFWQAPTIRVINVQQGKIKWRRGSGDQEMNLKEDILGERKIDTQNNVL